MTSSVWRRLQARLDRLTPLLRRQVERALLKLQRRGATDALEALDRLDVFALSRLTGPLTRDLRDAIETVARAFNLGLTSALAALPSAIGARLDLTNPFAIHAAERSAGQLVTGVTAETRRAIQAVVRSAFAEGLSPRETATLLRPLIGLTERQAMAVINRRFADLELGRSVDVVARRARVYAARLLKQRAEMIARTEIIRASVDGQQALWRQAQQQGLLPQAVRMRWLVTPDDRLCPVCAPMEGRTALIGGLFDSPLGPVSGPPLHPNCRCALVIAAQSLRAAA